MIVTVTANPSLDRAVALPDALRPGDVHRARSTREDAGGKGVNVARVLSAAGARALAVVPVAAHDPYHALLAASHLPFTATPASGSVRENLTITDPSGVTTKINMPGAGLTADEAAALLERVVESAAGASWLVLAGSLPPGVPDDFYAVVIRAVRERHGPSAPRVAVDASGPALHAAVATARPDLIKPNDEELAELVGESASAQDDLVADAARRAAGLVGTSVGAALVTLGSRGALLVAPEGVLRAAAPRIRVVSTVGAGDSALAGFLLADGEGAGAAECLRRSVAYGAAAATLPGTQPPRPDDLPVGDIPVAPFAIT